MPLEAPKLDKRTYEEIRNLVRLRIPHYTPEWTDFNESDPGATLIELFSWLSEMMLYQMNQIPERNYIKFLKLLNMELRPPVPATAHLSFTVQPGANIRPVPVRSQYAAQSPESGQLIIFETQKGIDLIPYVMSDVQVYDGSAFTVVSEANLIQETSFRPFGWVPQVGSALYLGFTPAEPVQDKSKFPQQLQFRLFLPATSQAGEAQSCDEVANPPAPPVSLVWEYRNPNTPDQWRPLTVFEDETAGFTREGYIQIEGPAEANLTNEGKIKETPRYWLRCRIDAGVYPTGRAPEIDFIRPNVVSALSLTTINNEIVDSSEGHPDQTFEISRKPVHSERLKLTVENEEGIAEEWKLVNDLSASDRNDKHYALNAVAGIITFGNGRNGRIPVAGAEIVAATYQYGGSTESNVAANAITIPLTNITGVNAVTNERPAVGGKDEQKLEELKSQAPSALRHRNRAVTPEDFAALALQAGGVTKSTALALAHPDFPDVEVPGAVSVVIVPDNLDHPPQPSGDLIRHVCNYLEDYRLLTTELYVKRPSYVEIQVEVLISVKPYLAFGRVENAVREALNNRLDPLEWTFGRDFYATGLYRDILKVSDEKGQEMVSAVPHLSINVDGIPHDDLRDAVRLKPDQLIYYGEHKITVVPEQDQ